MKFSPFFWLFALMAFSCKESKTHEINDIQSHQFNYLTKIKWEETQDSLFIYSGGEKVAFHKNELPLQTAMVIPTAAIAYLDELNLLHTITGVSQADYIYNPKIHQGIDLKKIEIIGGFNEIYVEKVMVNQPDLLISTSGPSLAKFHQTLQNQGLKVLYIDEYEELSPLARAEYIKLFGKLFDKEIEADALFDEIEQNYAQIQAKIQNVHLPKPTVLSNHIYGDTWYMPGGKSFQAKLYADAGGNYLWSETDNEATLNLSFESVFEKAANADVWVIAGDFESIADLKASYKNYEWFAPLKSGQVYSLNNRKSATGANDYFETGTARPDWVLKDLAKIFYPNLFPEHELFYYQKLE